MSWNVENSVKLIIFRLILIVLVAVWLTQSHERVFGNNFADEMYFWAGLIIMTAVARWLKSRIQQPWAYLATAFMLALIFSQAFDEVNSNIEFQWYDLAIVAGYIAALLSSTHTSSTIRKAVV